MENFKKRWEIEKNWQLIHPFLGIIGILLSAYLISRRILGLFIDSTEDKVLYYSLIIVLVLGLSYLLLHFFLWCFKKLEGKWITEYRWEIITIFIVFALTGSSSVRIAKPILETVGFTPSLFPDGFFGGFFYWIIRIIIILPLYQILLIVFGALFGQFKFFLAFEKKMLRRMGFAKWIKE